MAETTTYRATDNPVHGQPVPHDLFPLALTPFEHYLLLEDTPERPMNAFIELDFSTSLDLNTVERSLAIAIHRNPLLASRIARKDNSWQWIYDPQCHLKVLTGTDTPPAPRGRPRHIDLAREQGLRVWYLPTPSGSRLTFQIHHACSDGIGARRLLVDFLNAYAQLSGCERAVVQLDKLDANLLYARGVFGSEHSGGCRSSVSTWQRMRNAHYFFFQRPQTLAVPKQISVPSRATNWEEKPACQVHIDHASTALILSQAQEQRVGINELAIALLFHVCCRWNQEFGRTGFNKRLRILMPFDLRGKSHLRMPAANRMSFAFLGRTYRQCRDWPQLLQSVQAETRAIKDTRLSLDFLNGLSGAINKTPWLLPWLLRRCRPAATVVLTYGGDVFRGLDRYFPEENRHRLIGDARLKSVMGTPPVRIGTNISIGMCISSGELCYSAAWCRDDFTAEACDLFLSRYAAAWKNWATQNHPIEFSRHVAQPEDAG